MTMKITHSTNKKGYYKIYIDDELIGSLPKKFIPAEYFVETEETQSLQFAEFIEFTKNWTYKNATEKLLQLLAKMEKSVYECEMFLKKWDVPKNIIKKVIEEAKQRKWVCDKRYATLYAEEAKLCQKSPIETKYKLLQKKIPIDIIEQTIANIFAEENIHEIIKNHINKLLSRYADIPQNKKFEKIATALYRKGFEYSDYEEILKKSLQ